MENYGTKSNGSVIFLCVIVLTLLMTVAMVVWRSHILFNDIALQKELYEKKLRLTEAALILGISYAKEQVEKIQKKLAPKNKNSKKQDARLKPTTINLGAWPVGTKLYQARLIVQPEKDRMRVTAQLIDYAKSVFTIYAYVLFNGNVTDWSVGE